MGVWELNEAPFAFLLDSLTAVFNTEISRCVQTYVYDEKGAKKKTGKMCISNKSTS